MSRLLALAKTALGMQGLPPLVLLIEFPTLDVRFSSTAKNVTWDSKVWAGTKSSRTLHLDGVGMNLDFESPVAELKIGSIDGEQQTRFFNDSFRGEPVVLRLMYYDTTGTLLETGLQSTYTVDVDRCLEPSVSLRLGSTDAVQGTEAPRRSTQRDGCQNDFMQDECTFKPSAALPAVVNEGCDKGFDTPNGCLPHFPNITHPTTGDSIPQYKPYGGILGKISHKLVRSA